VSAVAPAVAAIVAGKPVILPTDTVYGLCADAYRAGPVERLARLKGRPEDTPIALLAASVDALVDCVPELLGRSLVVARALLPGPYTLIFPNPAGRYRWLSGTRPDTIGVRVPVLPDTARSVVQTLGAVAATSANLHGAQDPRRVEDISEELLRAVGAVVDAGELPGAPSTVIDLTGPEPTVLREGAVSADEALRKVAASLRSQAPA
jgi:L-threonylcarbamoyladenylate synthase